MSKAMELCNERISRIEECISEINSGELSKAMMEAEVITMKSYDDMRGVMINMLQMSATPAEQKEIPVITKRFEDLHKEVMNIIKTKNPFPKEDPTSVSEDELKPGTMITKKMRWMG